MRSFSRITLFIMCCLSPLNCIADNAKTNSQLTNGLVTTKNILYGLCAFWTSLGLCKLFMQKTQLKEITSEEEILQKDLNRLQQVVGDLTKLDCVTQDDFNPIQAIRSLSQAKKDALCSALLQDNKDRKIYNPAFTQAYNEIKNKLPSKKESKKYIKCFPKMALFFGLSMIPFAWCIKENSLPYEKKSTTRRISF